MNKQQLTDLVIIPTLDEIPNGYSGEAVMAIQMIIAHESSGGESIAQNNGPALGLIQMEPATHDDVWKYGDSIWRNAVNLGVITRAERILKKHPDSYRLVYDLRYNVFMARQKLFMAQGALPLNAKDMSVYLKKHWNGDGKATPEKYHNDFLRWV
jgi:hypothetical protein